MAAIDRGGPTPNSRSEVKRGSSGRAIFERVLKCTHKSKSHSENGLRTLLENPGYFSRETTSA